MNSRQRKTLERIFEAPTRADIPWLDIESLFDALGATISKRGGSMVGVKLDDVRAIFHTPHPRRHTDKGTVDRVRDFLEAAEVTP